MEHIPDFNKLSKEDRVNIVNRLSDETLERMMLDRPWQSSLSPHPITDEDGFIIAVPKITLTNFKEYQTACWNKVKESPHLSGYVNDTVGKIIGEGFAIQSHEPEIQAIIDQILTDPRNDLLLNIQQYLSRQLIEGELFLSLTLHPDGFPEIDFIDPVKITGGDDNSGVISHPTKPQTPLAYILEGGRVVPSHYVLMVPDYFKLIPDRFREKIVTVPSKKYSKINNVATYITEWKSGYLTKRNLSQISSVLEWLNYYELMKKTEIDYKRSATSYLWVVEFEDKAAFRLWLSMSDEEQKKTGLMAEKSPGGQLILPPGVSINVKSPELTSITDEDKDLLHFVTAGLGMDTSTLTGDYNQNTYASSKSARGPLMDRYSAYATYFERFIIYSLLRPIFYGRNFITGEKIEYKVKEVVKFINSVPRFSNVKRYAWELADVVLPLDDVADLEQKVKAYLGVKHGSVSDTLGISKQSIAKKLGFGSYKKEVMKYWSEKEQLPELPAEAYLNQDQESVQEKGISKDDTGAPSDNNGEEQPEDA